MNLSESYNNLNIIYKNELSEMIIYVITDKSHFANKYGVTTTSTKIYEINFTSE